MTRRFITGGVGVGQGASVSAYVEEPKQPAPKATRNKTLRAFNYRGIAFFLAKHDDGMTRVYVLNENTQALDLQCEVETDRAIKAAQALAKIVLAERELKEIEMLGKMRRKKG